jgi:hypothetical protein
MAKISHTEIKQPSFGEKRLILTSSNNKTLKLIQNVNGSVLISTGDTTFLLLLIGYFDVVLKTKSIMDKL